MPDLYSSREIERVLRKIGFLFSSQEGSHGKFKNASAGRTVILPMNKKEIPTGTLHSILRQAGLKLEQFKELLKK
ncbi:MAG: type II toxin-antitoxin system HicA family toxin [Candidatus Wallbacteria bacterium]|nr:type II toxin-antitoxin system HicA family toxin [Candidatus Wallbacteria bacterium]